MASIPEKTGKDTAHSIAKIAMSAVPVVGGTAGRIFEMVVATPFSKRTKEWMQSVEERIEELLKRKSLTVEELQSNPEFISVLTRASRLAILTHQEEKLEAFRNAILNTAIPTTPDEALREMFLNWIDSFTVWHIRILQLFVGPEKWFKEHNLTFPESHFGGSLEGVVLTAFPDLKDKPEFLDQVWKDLQSRGLLDISLKSMMTARGQRDARLKEQGKLFVEFISTPKS